MRRPAALALTLSVAFAPLAWAAPDPEALVEQAARCLRRGDPACAEAAAREALSLSDLPPALAREAAALALAALAALERADDAVAACARLRVLWPGYAPPPDADPRVSEACAKESKGDAPDAIPRAAGPLPEAGPSGGGTEAAAAPRAAQGSQSREPRQPRGLSLGGGPGVPLGPSADRFELGIHAALDMQVSLSPCWRLWAQGTLALLRLDPSVPVEPSQPTTLTAFTVTFGVIWKVALGARVDALAGLAAGLGGFGLDRPLDGFGLALSPLLGVRQALDDHLGLRLDLAPVVVVPFAPDLSAGGHLAVVFRVDASF
jgi:hypothetical protein